jgi:hypothetical protein
VTNKELESFLKNGSRPPEVEEAIARLKAERWTLYMRLVAPYFAATPGPNWSRAGGERPLRAWPGAWRSQTTRTPWSSCSNA